MNEGGRIGRGSQGEIPFLPDFDQVLMQVDRDSKRRELLQLPVELAEGAPAASSLFESLSGPRNVGIPVNIAPVILGIVVRTLPSSSLPKITSPIDAPSKGIMKTAAIPRERWHRLKTLAAL